jgi:hypothetical protein
MDSQAKKGTFDENRHIKALKRRLSQAWLTSMLFNYTAFHIKLPFLELDYTASAKCRFRHFLKC